MLRPFLAALCLLALPLALADAPAPDPTCQAGGALVHHYLPPASGRLLTGWDGNTQDCTSAPHVVGPLVGGIACAPAPPPILCAQRETPLPLEYDGELDVGVGGAFLFVETGDGATWGAAACFGPGSLGHHGTTVSVDEYGVTAWAPGLIAAADHSRAGLVDELPDCGDGYMEPCDGSPPRPSRAPFPVNVVEDTAEGVLSGFFEPAGAACNPLDRAYECLDVAADVNTCVFGPPGVDGALAVFVMPEPFLGRVPIAGHLWT